MDVKNILENAQIPFREKGKDLVVSCFNPEHDDKNPSCHVDSVTGVFHCWSCGYSGNVHSELGAPIDELGMLRNKLRTAVKKARGLVVGHNIPDKAIPFSEEYRGIPASIYQEVEAFTYSLDKDFQNRIWFPLYNVQGKIVSFIGRDLLNEAENKYKIHPPEAPRPMFPSVPNPRNGHLILVEGVFDVLNLWAKGMRNVTACLGVSGVSKDDIELMKLFGVRSIDVMLDGDSAGKDGAKKLLTLITSVGIEGDTIELPPNLDPGKMTQEQVNELRELLYG